MVITQGLGRISYLGREGCRSCHSLGAASADSTLDLSGWFNSILGSGSGSGDTATPNPCDDTGKWIVGRNANGACINVCLADSTQFTVLPDSECAALAVGATKSGKDAPKPPPKTPGTDQNMTAYVMIAAVALVLVVVMTRQG